MSTTRTHDHEIVIGSTTRRLTLLRERKTDGTQGKAYYSVMEEVPELLGAELFSQSDWVGGHGQYTFEDPTKYHSGQSIDTTQDGELYSGH